MVPLDTASPTVITYSIAEDAGPDLDRAILHLEMNRKSDLFKQVAAFNDWLILLLKRCQKDGIVRNPGRAEDLIPLQVHFAKSILFDWICQDGSFSLQGEVRNCIEIFYDVAPQYRKGKRP